MAIVVEEHRSNGGLLTVLLWAAVMVAVAVGLYYLFFKAPTLIEIKASGSFKNIQELSRINLDPKEVKDNAVFKSLNPYINTQNIPTPTGRSNPFLPL